MDSRTDRTYPHTAERRHGSVLVRQEGSRSDDVARVPSRTLTFSLASQHTSCGCNTFTGLPLWIPGLSCLRHSVPLDWQSFSGDFVAELGRPQSEGHRPEDPIVSPKP